MPAKERHSYTKEQLEEAVATSTTMAEVIRKVGLVPRGGNYENIRRRMHEWGIDSSMLPAVTRGVGGRIAASADDEIRKAVLESPTRAEAIRQLGCIPTGSTYSQLDRHIRRLRLPTAHMTEALRYANRSKRPLHEVLVRGKYVNSTWLRKRLIEDGVKEHKCERCGLREWQGQPIPLELNHKNGCRDDNRLENIDLLCPNCHALTPTYRGRNIGNGGRGTEASNPMPVMGGETPHASTGPTDRP
jgi:hypothetical protein